MHTAPRYGQPGRRLGAVLALAALAIASFVLLAQENKGTARQTAPEPYVAAVRVAQPQRAAYAVSIPAQGEIAAWETSVVSSEISGVRVEHIQVDVGEAVRAGQTLAQLDGSFLALEVQRLQAQTQQARIALQQAHDNAARARQLQATGSMAQQQIAAMLADEQSAAQQLQALEAQLHSQQLRWQRRTITAPDDAVVLAKDLALGQVVSAGQPLFRLLRQGRLEWRARVGAQDWGRITAGMPATLHTGDGTSYRGTVRAVQPDMDSRTREATVYVRLDAGLQDGLVPGMFAQGAFALPQREGWRVPQTAVVLRDGRSLVFKVGADSRVQAVAVALLAQEIPAGQSAGYWLVSGLDGTEAIVIHGGEFLADGQHVAVQPDAQQRAR